MDYAKLRAAALQDGGDEEAVTVDTRALIDKVLARYSGEWTTLRELIQNAADAQATTVKIKWETLPSTQVPLPATTDPSDILKHTLAHHTLRRLVVQNNGQPFTKTDWARLKRIAEGNPDETKIGAFGVGFYSVFADCEEPFVSSGPDAMAFYWKGNALFTRKLTLPTTEATTDTAFVLDYRNQTTTLPNLLSISQFLATSLTFVALESIEFWIDDYQLLLLRKKASPASRISLPRDVETTTKERIMKVDAVERSSAQIDATYMKAIGWKPPKAASANKSIDTYGLSQPEAPSIRSFFSRLTASAGVPTKAAKAAKEEQDAQDTISEDITARDTSAIFLRATTASIKTSVAASFAAELERATKKPPPKLAKLSILTSSYDETQASQKPTSSEALSKATDVFASVLPSKKPGGRIFIGFPTTQTTGAGMHISAPSVIPTVEREAIDLNARWVRTWNIEMLRAAGIMTRLAFIHEMSELQQKLQRSVETNGSRITPADIMKHMPEARHILNAFSFGDSTPSGHVSQIIEEAFWTSYAKPSIEVYSSKGVLLTTKVRLGSDELAKFVNGIPIVPPELKDAPFVQKLIEFSVITPITVEDILSELSDRPLNKEQMISFIQWAAKKSLMGELDPPSRKKLLDVAVAVVDGANGGQGEVIALCNITTFVSPNRIPAGLPIPPTTIPLEFTSKCSGVELQALAWDSLDIVPWLRFLIETGSRRSDNENMTKSSRFAIQVLTVLSKGWDNLSQGSKNTVVTILQAQTVMPTKLGMRKPTESFFDSVKIFDDLPNIEGCSSLKPKFLTAIGVRKTLDLDTIFKRLLNPTTNEQGTTHSKWSHVELIKYLASERADIPNEDMRKLKESRICPAEDSHRGSEGKGTSELYKASELYEPKAPLRNLGLKILHWPDGGFRAASPEAKFLAALGLRAHPSVPELVDMMASSDLRLRGEAMNYFISHHHANGYASFNLAVTTKAFLPIQNDPKKLVAPSECFTNTKAAVLGFQILKPELHAHANQLGVVPDPPMMECVNRLLRNPPQSHQDAVTLFGYFASRTNELGDNLVAKLRDAPIVPVTKASRTSGKPTDKSSSHVTHTRPRHCYLGSSSMYEDIFDFVDFGSNANAFLFRCGSKSEPTKLEIAHRATDEPAKLLSALQNSDKYINLLKTLAEDVSTLKRDKDLWRKMKVAPFLLGFKEINTTSDKEKGRAADADEEESSIRHYQLAAPQHIVIADDFISYRLFKDHLICAPEEDVLEAFYQALGSPLLSQTIQEDLRVGQHQPRQEGAQWLRKHVLERSKLFIHEYSRSSREGIKNDAKWLETNLSVEAVDSVSLCRSLRGLRKSHIEKRSAAVDKKSSSSPFGTRGAPWVLYISAASSRPDMYQVGQALCTLLLKRPSQQAYLFFEPFLKLDLLDLRARGYNVDRILRAKQAEARIAEEERRTALEAEQARIRERENEFRQQAAQVGGIETQGQMIPTAGRNSRPRMPGAFDVDDPESPEADKHASLPPPPDSKGPRGLFSDFTKRLGFNTSEAEQSLRGIFGGAGAGPSGSNNQPPPRGPQQPQALPGAGNNNNQDSGHVTNPAVVQQNLLNAVQSTRAHDSGSVFSPPTTQQVMEQASYCDDTPGQNLEFAADASNGMRVFISRQQHNEGQDEPPIETATFLQTNHRAINLFATMLRDLAKTYSMSPRSLHIFYDARGSTIAFNRDGSIFCNLRFFLWLHWPSLQASPTDSATAGTELVKAAVWWWVVLAHEIAHNIIKPHNADHSFYTESFIQEYFPIMMGHVVRMGQQAADALEAPAGGSAAPPPYREAN